MPKISADNLEAHRAETTDRLLDAWSELVYERGYEGVSLADVAKEIGLARTAIYNYFSDRESLLFAWTDREVAKTMSELEVGLAGLDAAIDKLELFVHAELKSFEDSHLPQGQEVVHFLGPDAWSRFMSHIEPVEKLLRSILEEGVDQGMFPGLDVEQSLPMVMACIGAERGALATGTTMLDEAAQRVMSFLTRALAAGETPQPPRRRR